MQYCYPLSNPVFTSLDDVQAVLEMMRKFGMKGLMNRVKGALVQQAFLDEHPLRVFAIAYRYSLEDEGRIAAKYTIREPFFAPYVKEVEHMPTSFYQKSMRGPSTSWSAPGTFFGSVLVPRSSQIRF